MRWIILAVLAVLCGCAGQEATTSHAPQVTYYPLRTDLALNQAYVVSETDVAKELPDYQHVVDVKDYSSLPGIGKATILAAEGAEQPPVTRIELPAKSKSEQTSKTAPARHVRKARAAQKAQAKPKQPSICEQAWRRYCDGGKGMTANDWKIIEAYQAQGVQVPEKLKGRCKPADVQ